MPMRIFTIQQRVKYPLLSQPHSLQAELKEFCCGEELPLHLNRMLVQHQHQRPRQHQHRSRRRQQHLQQHSRPLQLPQLLTRRRLHQQRQLLTHRDLHQQLQQHLRRQSRLLQRLAVTPTPTATPTPSATPRPSSTPIPSPIPTATPTNCIVPNFLGQKINRAQTIWRNAGFTTQVIVRGGRGQKISRQSIPAGTSANCNTTIITVSAR